MADTNRPAARTHFLANPANNWDETRFDVRGSVVVVTYSPSHSSELPAKMARDEYRRLVREGWTKGRAVTRRGFAVW
jgi:hypothetical protein